ncbi:MAG: heme exporter protein CcmD [Hyphomonadaceae bacterium]
MIEGGWEFIWPAYAVALGALAVLAIVVVTRLRAWERRARDLDKPS